MKKYTLIFIFSLAWSAARAAEPYEATNLPQPVGALGANPSALSQGIVALNATFPSSDSARTYTVPYLWSGGILTALPLGTYGGGSVLGLNDLGSAVGYVTDSGGARYPALWSAGQLLVLNHGAMPEGAAFSINHQGQIAGQISTHDGADFSANAAVWNGTALTDLGNFGGTQAAAKAINANGQVLVVASGNSGNGVFLSGQTTTAMGSAVTGATSIDNAGQVLATDTTGSNVLWQNGSLSPVGSAGGLFDVPLAMNNEGDIVGYAETADFRTQAVLWQGGQPENLSTLAGPGWDLTIATGISDDGSIVAAGSYQGTAAMVLLTPQSSSSATLAPEPATAITLLLAGAILVRRNRRRT